MPFAEGLIQFLVNEKTFNEQRIRSAIDRINAAKGKSNQGEYIDSWDRPACVPQGVKIQVGLGCCLSLSPAGEQLKTCKERFIQSCMPMLWGSVCALLPS